MELGCGTGSTALALAGAAAEIVATDFSAAMIALGKQKAAGAGVSNLRFMVAEPGDARLLADGTFDVVMGFHLLHLIEDLPRALAQIHDHLRPGGLFISKTFCRPGPGEGNMEYLLTRLALPVMQAFGKAPFVGFMKVEKLEQHVIDAGFEIVETGTYPARPPRRFLVARKPG